MAFFAVDYVLRLWTAYFNYPGLSEAKALAKYAFSFTGIISAGFVDQYSPIKRVSEYAKEDDVHFIKVQLHAQDSWVGKTIMDLRLPRGMIVAMVRRGRENII